MARLAQTILDSLFNNAILKGLLPSVLKKTRIGILFAVLASEIAEWEVVMDNFRSESYLADAKLKNSIIKICEPFYSKTEEKPSETILMIKWIDGVQTKADTVIPFGTIVQTSDSNPIQYMTIEETVLYKTASVIHVRARSVESGANTMIPAGAITSFVNQFGNISVTNTEASWGGRDEETIENVRSNAMASRYSLVKGTKDHIRLVLSSLGLYSYQYNIEENAYGEGSFAIYVDTTSEYYLKEIEDAIKVAKAAGVYAVIEGTESIPITFNFYVKVVNKTDITPQQRDNIKKDLTAGIQTFIKQNGVGQTLLMSHLTHYLYDQFLDKYQLFDVAIKEVYVDEKYLDEDGNIYLRPYQVINAETINITIETG